MPGSARFIGLAALCALASACEPPTDPISAPPRRLVIHAVLDGGTLAQSIKVQWSDSGFGRQLIHVAGAEVTITTPQGEVVRAEERSFAMDSTTFDPYYRIIGLSLTTTNLVPGGTYTLNVRTPTGEEASGTTTVPRYATSSPPAAVLASFDRERDTLRLAWPRIPLAKRYQVDVRSSFVFDTLTFFRNTYSVFTDTSITIPGTARTLDNDEVFVPSTTTMIQVTAVDDNYYAYYHPNVDPFAGAPASRLTGAIGVFGAVVPVLIRVYQEVR